MAYNDLRQWIEKMESEGELLRVKTPVSAILEITEIADRCVKSGKQALLFERVDDGTIPVLINGYASRKRMCMALERDSLDDLSEEVSELLSMKPPENLLEKIKFLPKLGEVSNFLPKIVKSGQCQEIVNNTNPTLDGIPILKCWPEDGGRFVTLPLVFTKDPETGERNCGMYRMQVFDGQTTGMHWHIHKHGAAHYRKAEKLGKRLEVAVAIGSDPAVTFASTLPAPPGLDEMLLAGLIRKSPVKLVKCKTVDLEIPANAEFVLEGYVEPGERRREGPFGDHTGFYSLPDDYPVFHLTCLTHRENPIYHATVVGKPPMEDCYMGEAISRMFLPLIRKQYPEIVDMHMPFAGVFHNMMLVSIRKQYPGHARQIMHAIWGMGQAAFTKVIVVVDEDVDVQNPDLVLWTVLNHIDPERDTEIVHGPVDVLDHASRLPQYGSKVGIDGTRKWPEEGFTRPWPDPMEMTKDIIESVNKKWKEMGLE